MSARRIIRLGVEVYNREDHQQLLVQESDEEEEVVHQGGGGVSIACCGVKDGSESDSDEAKEAHGERSETSNSNTHDGSKTDSEDNTGKEEDHDEGCCLTRACSCVKERLCEVVGCIKALTDPIVKYGKEKFGIFKASACGILLLARILPLQDVGSDLLVTFCVDGFPLCSNKGLWWTSDYWWAHLSVLFIILPYLIMWLAGSMIIMDHLQKYNRSKWLILFWFIFGLPAVVLLDIFLLLAYTTSHPTITWLLNFFRLRVVLETLVEAPTQLVLQVRIAFYRFLYRDAAFPWTVVFSIFTSLISITLTMIDLKADADAAGVSIFAVVKDLLLVGLGRRAPLVHVLRLMRAVDYSGEGRLKEEHITEILSVCQTCPVLKELQFGDDSGLTSSHLHFIIPLIEQLEVLEVPNMIHLDKRSTPSRLHVAECPRTRDVWRPIMSLIATGVETIVVSGILKYSSTGSESSLMLTCNDWPVEEFDIRDVAMVVGRPSNLTMLTLDASKNAIDDSGAQVMAEELAKLSNLKSLELYLKSDGLGDAGIEGISVAVRNLAALTSLQLNLTDNSTSDSCTHLECFVPLLSTLQCFHIPDVLKLNMSSAPSCLRVTSCPWTPRILQHVIHVIPQLQIVDIPGILEYDSEKAALSLTYDGLTTEAIGMKQVSDVIGALTNLIALTLKVGKGTRMKNGAKDIAGAVERLLNLTTLHLDFDNNSLGEKGAESLATALGQLSGLTSLHLNLASNALGEKGAERMAAGVGQLQGLFSLHLDLYNNSLGEKGAESLATALGQLQGLTAVHLNFNKNSLGNKGAASLAAALGQLQGLTVLHLDFTRNYLGDEAAKSLASALGQLHGLTSFHLNFWSNSLGEKGAESLAASFGQLQGLKSLHLNVAHNTLGDKGAESLAAGVGQLHGLTSLHLKLASNGLGEKGAESLAAAFGQLQILTCLHLDVAHNTLADKGAESLAAAFGQLQSLTSLHLNFASNALSKRGAASLAAAVGQLQGLHVDLAGNALSDEVAASLAAREFPSLAGAAELLFGFGLD